jgi:hypothetical protein
MNSVANGKPKRLQLPGLSPLRSDGFLGSQAGRLYRMSGGQGGPKEKLKKTLGSHGGLINGQSNSPKKSQLTSYLLFRGCCKGEIVEDDDDEVRTTMQSQICSTETLSTEEPFA